MRQPLEATSSSDLLGVASGIDNDRVPSVVGNQIAILTPSSVYNGRYAHAHRTPPKYKVCPVTCLAASDAK